MLINKKKSVLENNMVVDMEKFFDGRDLIIFWLFYDFWNLYIL